MPADTIRVSGLGAEARFVSADSATGIQTMVVVFTDSRAILDSPQQGGPDDESFTIIQVTQESASGDLLCKRCLAPTCPRAA